MKKVTLAVAAAFALSTAIPAYAGSYVAPEDDDVMVPIVAQPSIGGGVLAAGAVLAILAIAASGDS